jgi:hypothetical protein
VSFCCEVSLGPAFDLAPVVAFGMSQICEASGGVVERMKVGEVLDEASTDSFASLLRGMQVCNRDWFSLRFQTKS